MISTARAFDRATVEIFVTEWCPHCRNLEAFLKKEGIPFVRYDIERDRRGKQLYLQLGAGGVPLIRIGKKILRGFDPNAIRRALQNPRAPRRGPGLST